MPLPYSYKNKVEIPDSEGVDVFYATNAYAEYIDNMGFENFEFDDGIISFIADYSFVNFKYKVDLHIKKDELITVGYEIHLIQLIKITLAIVVFIAFFSGFGMSGFLWFSFIFASVFFFVNILFADTHVQKIIKSTPLYLHLNPPAEDGYTEEQKKWLTDTNRCPACGEEINIYDVNCPECGLKLTQNQYTIPLDVTKYKEKRFKYHYKKKTK
jgi:prepilin-type processing-associated H-X9-DG protein